MTASDDNEQSRLAPAIYAQSMTLPFRVAKECFEGAVQAARRNTFVSPVEEPGRRRYEMQITPKKDRAALRAALELMQESATTAHERNQVSEARVVMQGFRGSPSNHPIGAIVDAINMNGRKRRIKREMIQTQRVRR